MPASPSSPTMPFQVGGMRKPGNSSVIDGYSGCAENRTVSSTARTLSKVVVAIGHRLGELGEVDLDVTADQVGEGRDRAAVRHMRHVHAGNLVEQFAGEVEDEPAPEEPNDSVPGWALA